MSSTSTMAHGVKEEWLCSRLVHSDARRMMQPSRIYGQDSMSVQDANQQRVEYSYLLDGNSIHTVQSFQASS